MGVRGFQRARVAVLVVIATVATAACGEVKDPITFDPTPLMITDTFNGTLTTGETKFHAFANTVAGTITVKLVTVGPDNTLTLGIDIGTWDGLACNPIFGTGSRAAAQGYSFAGSAVAANFCIRVYDGASLIPADTEATYSVTVEHR